MADWDDQFGSWDGGQTWDADSGGNPGDVTPYLSRITSKHNQQPDFIAFLTALLQPLADAIAINGDDLLSAFDLDTAVGVQLDAVGLWVGRTRQLTLPIVGVYFTYNTGPGYQLGIYKGPFDPSTGLVALPDAQYRTLLKAVINANHWNGSIPGAYVAYGLLFAGTPFSVLIYDYQDMTMSLALIGAVPDALTKALFTGGYLSLKPIGVHVRDYIVPVNSPVFCYNIHGNPGLAGYNTGAYAQYVPG